MVGCFELKELCVIIYELSGDFFLFIMFKSDILPHQIKMEHFTNTWKCEKEIFMSGPAVMLK